MSNLLRDILIEIERARLIFGIDSIKTLELEGEFLCLGGEEEAL